MANAEAWSLITSPMGLFIACVLITLFSLLEGMGELSSHAHPLILAQETAQPLSQERGFLVKILSSFSSTLPVSMELDVS